VVSKNKGVMAEMSLLVLKNVKKIYHQGVINVPALKGVELIVEKGEFTTVFGPSGSGKTTLLNVIGCLDKPTEGEIYFTGDNIAELDKQHLAEIRRKNIGFVFQSYNLIPVLTAYENVEFAIKILKNISSREIKKRVFKMLELVGLQGLENRKPNELSGGQKQRVAIARSLVKKPKLVLADEPTANLDSKTGEDVLKIMLEMNEELKTTFLFSTHDPLVMDYAQRKIELKDGQITRDERREELDVFN